MEGNVKSHAQCAPNLNGSKTIFMNSFDRDEFYIGPPESSMEFVGTKIRSLSGGNHCTVCMPVLLRARKTQSMVYFYRYDSVLHHYYSPWFDSAIEAAEAARANDHVNEFFVNIVSLGLLEW